MDYFSRIGTVLEDLVNNSTLNGDKRAEALRLTAELRAVSDNLVVVINDRVRAATEELAGRTTALEDGRAKVDAVVFSTSNAASLGIPGTPAVTEEETTRLKDLFNGADPKLFDGDANGAPGGSLPAEPTEDPAQMTVAQAKAWLDDHQIDYTGVTLRDDLRKLVADAQVTPDAPEPVVSMDGPDTLSGT